MAPRRVTVLQMNTSDTKKTQATTNENRVVAAGGWGNTVGQGGISGWAESKYHRRISAHQALGGRDWKEAGASEAGQSQGITILNTILPCA